MDSTNETITNIDTKTDDFIENIDLKIRDDENTEPNSLDSGSYYDESQNENISSDNNNSNVQVPETTQIPESPPISTNNVSTNTNNVPTLDTIPENNTSMVDSITADNNVNGGNIQNQWLNTVHTFLDQMYNSSGTSSDAELEALMTCQAIAACIIENYDVLDAYVCTDCGEIITAQNEDGEEIEVTTNNVENHVRQHYIRSGTHGLAGVYPCDVCNQEFYSNNSLTEHRASVHPVQLNNEDDGSESDNESEYQNNLEEYQYRCPICSRGYNDQIDLGNHFMRRHNNYDVLNMLDQKPCDGFPGFDVLNKIGMMRMMHFKEKLSSNNCPLCFYEYDIGEFSASDDILYTNLDKYSKYNTFRCDTRKIYIDRQHKVIRKPIKMLCCKTEFCNSCLRKHINSKYGEPECPFCRKNHTRNDKKYIVFDERPQSKIDLESNPYQEIKESQSQLLRIQEYGRIIRELRFQQDNNITLNNTELSISQERFNEIIQNLDSISPRSIYTSNNDTINIEIPRNRYNEFIEIINESDIFMQDYSNIEPSESIN